MAIDRSELHDLLDERSRPAADRPIPWESLRRRTGRARHRRLTAAVASAAALVVVVVVGVSGGLLGLGEPDRDDPTVASVADPIPARYVEPDGTVYRRIATATLDAQRQKSVSFDVEVGDRPLAILASCPTGATSETPNFFVRVPGVAKLFTTSPIPGMMSTCDDNRAMDVMPLPEGTRRATFTVETPRRGTARERPQRWRFGVYEWTPPATLKAAPTPVEPPAKFSRQPEFRLVTKKTVTWPAAREVEVTVPYTGRQLALMAYCGGGIAGRLDREDRVNGRPTKTAVICESPPDGRGFGYAVLGTRTLPAKGPVTIQVRVKARIPEYLRRPGTLTVAVYEAAE
ncbi:hypothetical protein [Nonomuraea sp. LPB2021202275-12-8]|uniref:hypothetical protein n=1 Tax=Nonomuraea sp. LPB2021202275-12-8 TaxID=3120159 RepID=UPI00300C28FC